MRCVLAIVTLVAISICIDLNLVPVLVNACLYPAVEIVQVEGLLHFVVDDFNTG